MDSTAKGVQVAAVTQGFEVKTVPQGGETVPLEAALFPSRTLLPPAAGRQQFKTIFNSLPPGFAPALAAGSDDLMHAAVALRHESARFAHGPRLIGFKRREGAYAPLSINSALAFDPIALMPQRDGFFICALLEPGKWNGDLVQRIKLVCFGIEERWAAFRELISGPWKTWGSRLECAISDDCRRAVLIGDHHLRLICLGTAVLPSVREQAEIFVSEEIQSASFIDRGRRLAAVLRERRRDEVRVLRIWELPDEDGEIDLGRAGETRFMYDEPIERVAASREGDQLAIATPSGIRLYAARRDGCRRSSLVIKGVFPLPEGVCVNSLGFAPGGRCLYVGRSDAVLGILAPQHIEDGKIVEVRHFVLNEPVQAIACGRNGALVALQTSIERLGIEFFKSR